MKFSIIGLLLVLISGAAYAEGGAAAQGAGLGQFLILGVFAFLMFWMMRAQSKKAKEHQKLVGNLQKGDEVITSGGILGKITKVSDSFFTLQLSEGIEVFVQKSMVINSVPKGTMRSL